MGGLVVGISGTCYYGVVDIENLCTREPNSVRVIMHMVNLVSLFRCEIMGICIFS